MNDSVEQVLTHFAPITLEEMSAVKLMNRIDSKYLVSQDRLPEILAYLTDGYFVQENVGRRIAHYNTLYYDTPDAQMYVAHHNQKLTRQKLRARIYCDTDTAFCEIKNKTNKKRTKKKRIGIEVSQFGRMLEFDEPRRFVVERLNYDVNTLVPQVENEFDRITLVNRGKSERLTIDMNIRFRNRHTEKNAEVPHLVIIELKQDGNTPSFFKRLLRDLRIRPYRISKYCLGTILTNPDVKYNRFKKKLRYIEFLKSDQSSIKNMNEC